MSELADDEPSLLNVDLVLESERPFEQLIEALSTSLFVMDEGSAAAPASPYRARFETNLVRWSTVREVVDELAAAIDGLSPEARAEWEGLSSRVFDVGLQAGLRCGPHETPIDEHSLATIVRLGGRLLVTVYAPVAPE